MTLCIAAACEENRIVTLMDTRTETAYSGSDTGFKFDWIARGWTALLAGEMSKAEEFTATLRSMLKAEEFTRENIWDKLNEGSCAHKEKLCKQMIGLRLGISWERFLASGDTEVSPEVRNRLWYEVQDLKFGCELVVCGFINNGTHIFRIDDTGNVSGEQNFASVGTGSMIAESVLDRRGQSRDMSLEQTIYNVAEAFALTVKGKAPGVGGMPHMLIAKEIGSDVVVKTTGLKLDRLLSEWLRKYSPKDVGDLQTLDDTYFFPEDAPENFVSQEKAKGDES